MAKKLLKLTTLLSILLLVFMLTGCPKPPEEYTLTIEKTGNGTVTANPAPNTSGKYTAGTEVTLTAEAAAGWQFVKWVVGETDVTENPGKVTMNADKTVEAVFEEEEPPTDKYTLTITKTGQGTVVPAEGVHEYDEDTEVVLTATPAVGWNFSKWVVGGTDVVENPTTVVMTSNKAANAVFVEEEPPVGPFPKITNLSLTTEDFMVLQPCTENLEIRFQVAVSGPESALVEAEYKVIHVSSGEFVAVEISEDNWGAPWTYTISNNFLKDNIGNPIPGGKYDITVGATNTEGNFSSKTISFYVKYELSSLEDAWIVDSEDSQIKVVEGKCVVGEGDPATIGATIFYDSKITVRIYLVETSDTGTLDEMLTKGVMIKEKAFIADSAVTEDVEIELPDLKPLMDAGTEYNLLVLLFTPECGALGCVSCGIEDWALLDCDLVEDTDPSIECLPCTCPDPCDPCFKLTGYNPGIRISNVLNTNPALFDITLTIGEEVIESGFTFLELADALEVRYLIEEGTLDPDPSGDTDLYWTVVTPTGVELDATCTILIDFEEPEADIVIENCCVNEGITETTFSVTFTDNVGLKRGKISATGANVVLPDGKTAGNWFALSGTEATVEGTITGITGVYTVTVEIEDVSCIFSKTVKECGINTPPMVDFGPWCHLFECPPPCDAEEIELYWGIADEEDNFTHFEIYVSHSPYGKNVKLDVLDPEQMEGHITWELGAVNCETVTATLIAYDDCDGTTSSKTKVWSSPYLMDNVEPEIELFWEDCGEPGECATSAVLGWKATDPCLDEIWICVEQGYLVHVTDNTNSVLELDAGTYKGCWGTDLATLTSGGTITWIFEDAVDCENIVAKAWAADTCGNIGIAEPLVSKNIIDNMEPGVFLGIIGLEFDLKATLGDIVDSEDEFLLDEFRLLPIIYTDTCSDATCLMLVWVVEENCVEDISITTNYPLNACNAGQMERPVGSYTYDPKHISLWWDTFTPKWGRDVTIGLIPFCLPYIDCDDFEAVLTADDWSDCTEEVSDYASITIDNVPPETRLEWDLTPCSTEVTLTWSLTDNSFPCSTCDSSIGCPIGGLVLRVDGEEEGRLTILLDSLGNASYDGVFIDSHWEIAFDKLTKTVYGTITGSNEELDCVEIEVELYAYGCCCYIDFDDYSGTPSKTLKETVDNVSPVLEVELPDLKVEALKFCKDEFTTKNASVTIEATATDECFDELVVEVTHGTLPNGLTVWATNVEGFHTLVWDLSELDGKLLDCTEVTLTITAYDEAGCEPTEWATSFKIDNMPPEIEFYADPIGETCGATFVDLFYCIDDDCLTCGDCTTMAVAYIDLSSPMASGPYEGMTRVPITAECGCPVPLCGTFTWLLGDVDCGETLVATLVAWDTSGNISKKGLEIGDVDNKAPVVEEFSTNMFDSITWDATDNCFDSISIWVSHGKLPDITVFPPTNFEAAQFVPPAYSDQGITFEPAGTTTWTPPETYVGTVTFWLAAYDDCCNETLDATSFYWNGQVQVGE